MLTACHTFTPASFVLLAQHLSLGHTKQKPDERALQDVVGSQTKLRKKQKGSSFNRTSVPLNDVDDASSQLWPTTLGVDRYNGTEEATAVNW